MTLYQKLERKLGRYAIQDLMKYICVMYVVGYLIQSFNPLMYYYYLDLDPEAILHGHVWRLVTFLFYYPSSNIFWVLIGVFVYYSLGQTLERVWGTFKYNFFFAMGVLLMIVTSIGTYVVTYLLSLAGLCNPYPLQLYPTYMTFSIFLAYALTFPEATFLLYFLIPIKAKYLAAGEVMIYLVLFVMTPGIETKVAILLALANVGLFFYLTTRRPKNRKIFNIRDYR